MALISHQPLLSRTRLRIMVRKHPRFGLKANTHQLIYCNRFAARVHKSPEYLLAKTFRCNQLVLSTKSILSYVRQPDHYKCYELILFIINYLHFFIRLF